MNPYVRCVSECTDQNFIEMAARNRSLRNSNMMDDTFDDKSGSDRSDCMDLSDDEDDDFMDLGTDFDSESESSGDESDTVVPLMDVGASPSRNASSNSPTGHLTDSDDEDDQPPRSKRPRIRRAQVKLSRLDIPSSSHATAATPPTLSDDANDSDDDEDYAPSPQPNRYHISDSDDDDVSDNARHDQPVRGRARGRGRQAGRGRRRGRNPHVAPKKWDKVRQHDPIIHQFTAAPGIPQNIKDNMPQDSTPADYYQLYITDTLLQHIVDETNRYADQLIESKRAKGTLKKKSRLKSWKPTDCDEMKKFFGLLYLTGLVKKGKYSDYWAKEFLPSTPGFGTVMGRDRFMLIKRCLHLNDNEAPGYDPAAHDRDRLHKIRPVLNHINDRCHQVYVPDRELSVDESLVLFRGRLIFKQAIRTKRARAGIKMYPLCTSDGITMALRIHSGSNVDTMYEDQNYQFLKSEQITLNLLQPYFGKGYHVYTDNYYTSPQLAAYLSTKNTHLCGTVKHNRQGMPKDELRAENLDRGQIAHFLHEDKVLLALKYREAMDRSTGKPKVVHMLTTMHDCSTVDTGRVTRRDPPLAIIKPKCVSTYNKYMGGVDKTDQMLGLRSLCPMRKSLKWYQKLFIRLLLQMHLNAYQLYQKENHNSKRSLRWFVYEVVKTWTTSNAVQQQHGAPRGQNERTVRLNGKIHMPWIVPNSGQNKGRAQRNCRVCTARGHRTSTTTMCKTCVEHSVLKTKPGLCIKVCTQCDHLPDRNCWEVWHSQRFLMVDT